MSEPHGRLWVNPEGVTQIGNAYARHVTLYDQHLARLQLLRSQYADSWGDDDMGKEFSQKFLSGMDNLEGLIRAVRGSLNYTATGLRESGKAYGEADDDAREASARLGKTFTAD